MTAQELAEIRARFEERGITYQGSSLDFNALLAEVERLQAERDAAVADLHKALRSEVSSPCDLCLYDVEAPDGMHSCSIGELLSDPCTAAEWRGAKSIGEDGNRHDT